MSMFDKFKEQNRKPQNTQPENVRTESTLVPSIGRIPFPAYRGREPYIFISYAHLDADIVFPEIKSFNENGYNVWYDEGISPGNEWTGDIAHALENCALFVVFITPNSVDSFNVLNEINFAIGDRKPFIAIHLVETVLKGGLKLQISTIQAILKYKMTEEEYVYKYTTAFTRLGLHQRAKPAAPAGNPPAENTAPAAAAQPQEPPVQNAGETGDFLIDHGLLREYLGHEKDVVFPDEVQLVGAFSLGRGSAFVETVGLNKTGAILNGAFSGCPNLREIKIPRSVTMIQDTPFANCPELTLYCFRDQLPAGFTENFGGKAIVYLDEGAPERPAGRAAATISSTPSPAATSDDHVVFSSPEMHKNCLCRAWLQPGHRLDKSTVQQRDLPACLRKRGGPQI